MPRAVAIAIARRLISIVTRVPRRNNGAKPRIPLPSSPGGAASAVASVRDTCAAFHRFHFCRMRCRAPSRVMSSMAWLTASSSCGEVLAYCDGHNAPGANGSPANRSFGLFLALCTASGRSSRTASTRPRARSSYGRTLSSKLTTSTPLVFCSIRSAAVALQRSHALALAVGEELMVLSLARATSCSV